MYSNWSSHNCGKNAKYEHEGKWYCGTHNPPVVAARRKARDDKWKQDMDKDKALNNARKAVNTAESNVLSMVYAKYDELPTVLQRAYDELREAKEALEAVIH